MTMGLNKPFLLYVQTPVETQGFYQSR